VRYGAGSGAAEAADARARDTLLRDLLGSEVWGCEERSALQVQTRELVGEVRHVFTHRVHTYCVERLRVTLRGGSTVDLPELGRGGQSLRWVEDALIESQGLTTGVKKIFELARRGGRKGGGEKRQARKKAGGALAQDPSVAPAPGAQAEPKRARPAEGKSASPSRRGLRRRTAD
jgi:hypothetical protein